MYANRKPALDSHPELPLDPDVLQPRSLTRPAHLTAGFQAIVFLGGCLGTLARYGVTTKLAAAAGKWPEATFTVNIIGAFLLGLLLETLARRGSDTGFRRLLRLALGTGFMGAFTTYSSLAIDTNLLARHGSTTLAVVYALTSAIGGVLVCMLGIRLAAAVHKRPSK